ncbi:MAG TPA: glycosyltransferase family 39 protein [Xanthobacteraceae bacterium]|nr:glycosyltransferase family 39 protein [Xanthobacteraceae bacterium]
MDALAVAVLILVAAIATVTFRDYGLGWDDYTHSQYGDLLVSLYASGFADKRALSFVNLYMYGGGFDLLSALAAKVLPFSLFETRRLVGAAIGIVGLLVTWRLGRRVGGPLAGLIALLLLAACPLYYGHMFINAKDGPFAAANVLALLGIVRAFEEYPRATPATIALCGVGLGLAIGARILGGFTVLDALLPLLFVLAIRSHASGFKPALGEWSWYLVAFIPAAILAYLIMGLVWPWSVVAPLNPVRAAEYFSRFFEKPWHELFAGHLIEVTQMPREYVPVLLALQVPILMLSTGLAGTIGAFITAVRGSQHEADIRRRAVLLALVLAPTVPVAVTVATQPGLYNGIRHFVFILPPLAVLGGLSVAWIAQRLERFGHLAMVAGALAVVTGVASPVVEMVRLHPYEYTYYNRLVGGSLGARPRYMLDYWGLSLTQASRKLLAYLAEHHETPPEGRWTVAVCGPHPPVNVALGPQFELTWNPKGADFAMMLGEFYCAKLDAPVLFQIERDGIVYARVYDLRERSISTLFTLPPP